MPRLLAAHALDVDLGGRPVIRGATLHVDAGELVGVVGPNGAGKSTLLRALAGVVPLRGGRVELAGSPLPQLDARARARRLAYLAQERTIGWDLDVRRIVALGRHPHGDGSRAANDAAVARAMQAAGVADLATRHVLELSGGERARVLLARALAVEAPLLLADEPIASLDVRHQLAVMQLLRQVAGTGAGVACVLHDLTLAARFCDRLLVVADGRIVANAAPAQALTRQRIASVFGVDAIEGEAGGERYVLPWQALPQPPGDGTAMQH
jgi:iron complex transport system ATP-binding protein